MKEYLYNRRPIMAPRNFVSMFDLAEEFLKDFDVYAPSKLPDIFVSSTFPPCNIMRKSDNSLEYEFAVAGYSLEEISIQFDNDHLILTLAPEKQEEDEKVTYRQMGIKRAKSTSKFYVPINKFDVELATATLDKGILKISIPAKEIAKPKQLKIDIK
jgi:HSP20 family molecular chaperone IbpA